MKVEDRSASCVYECIKELQMWLKWVVCRVSVLCDLPSFSLGYDFCSVHWRHETAKKAVILQLTHFICGVNGLEFSKLQHLDVCELIFLMFGANSSVKCKDHYENHFKCSPPIMNIDLRMCIPTRVVSPAVTAGFLRANIARISKVHIKLCLQGEAYMYETSGSLKQISSFDFTLIVAV